MNQTFLFHVLISLKTIWLLATFRGIDYPYWNGKYGPVFLN
jgi:hypothetical protein